MKLHLRYLTKVTTLFLFLCFPFHFSREILAAYQSDKGLANYTQIDLCEILRNPQQYDGKQVVVRASYRYGFEWQELFCMRCRKQGKTWLEFSFENDTTIRRALRKAPKHQGIVNATFYGIFQAGGSYGDGWYSYKIDLRFVKDVKIISRNGGVPESLPSEVRKQLCQE
jgi:hypothetical protein